MTDVPEPDDRPAAIDDDAIDNDPANRDAKEDDHVLGVHPTEPAEGA